MTTMAQAAGEYLEMRRSLGCKLVTQGRLLLSFAGSMDAAGQQVITAGAAVDWASHPPHGTRPEYWCRRLRPPAVGEPQAAWPAVSFTSKLCETC